MRYPYGCSKWGAKMRCLQPQENILANYFDKFNMTMSNIIVHLGLLLLFRSAIAISYVC